MQVGVMGLGMAGLYQALELWHHGHVVTGYDTDADRVAAIRSGAQLLPDVPAEVLKQALASGRFAVHAQPQPLGACATVLISVPTDVDSSGKPDVTHLAAAATVVAKHCAPGVLVVVKSTAYPGMVRAVVGAEIESRLGPVGSGWYLAYAPERGDPGNRTFAATGQLPKVVAGATPACAERVVALYRAFGGPVHVASSLETAELVKLHENVFRFINIGYVNEVAELADNLGVDIGEVIELAATKPFGFMAFHPGAGVGGMYVPVNPSYLLAAADAAGAPLRIVEAATRVNDDMPATVLHRLRRAVGSLTDRRVLVLGVTYKPGSADLRRSPARAVVRALAAEARVSVIDPYAAGAMLPEVGLPVLDMAAMPRPASGTPDAFSTPDRGAPEYDLALLLVAHAEFAAFTADPPMPCLDALGRWLPHPAVAAVGPGERK